MQHFLSFNMSYYKPNSGCVSFRASLLQYPLFCLCLISTENIHLPRNIHCRGCASLYLPLPTCSLLCHIYSDMLSFVSQGTAFCISLLPSPNPQSMPRPSPAQPGALLSSGSVGCLVSAHGLWHQHLPLALELQAMLAIPRCFKLTVAVTTLENKT